MRSKRVLITGLSTYWGGRLARALEGDPSVEAIVGVDNVDPSVELERTELRMQLVSALGKLHERERKVLALYYEEELTMAEIARVLGLSESRISQLRSLALSRLRTWMRASRNPLGPTPVAARKAAPRRVVNATRRAPRPVVGLVEAQAA